MNFLSEQEKTQLKRQHKKERDKRVCDRIKAVLLSDEGWTSEQIAKVLLITDQAVRNHIGEYQSERKLEPKSGGSTEKLSADQSEQLELHLQKHTYLYVKDMLSYIKIEFGVEYTVPGLRSWLQRHGFTYKKPSIVPGKADK